MNKPTNLYLAFFAILFALGLTLLPVNVKAQAAIKVFKVGDRVEMNVANDVQNDDRWIKGTVTEIIYTDDGRILSYKVKRDAAYDGYIQQFGNLARVIRPLSDGSDSANTTTRKEEPPTQTDNAQTAAASGDCSFEKYPQVKSSMKFSEVFIKDELFERYAFEANTGSLSSPLAVGLTFLNIKIGSSYTNTVTVVPGRGAQRKQDGAPVNAKIYPFSAKYIVCNKYKNETTRTQYESNFVCFIDKNGDWNCPVDSVPKITHLN